MRIACVQMKAPELTFFERTYSQILELLGEALKPGVDLVVFPECTWPAYFIDPLESQVLEEALSLNGQLIESICHKARENSSYVALGLIGKEEGKISNDGILVDPSGKVILRASKMNLWHFDKDIYEPGKRFDVVETPFGRVGLLICADARLPEIPRILSLMSADLIIDLANLTGYSFSPKNLTNPQLEFMLQTRAFENQVWWILSNKCGIESETIPYVGGSRVISPDGITLVSASSDKEEIIFADIDLPREEERIHPKRIPETYAVIKEPTIALPVVKISSEPVIPSHQSFFLGVAQFGAENVEEYLAKTGKFLDRLGRLHSSLVVLPYAGPFPESNVFELSEMIAEKFLKRWEGMIIALSAKDSGSCSRGVLFDSGKVLASSKHHGWKEDRLLPLSVSDINQTAFGNISFVDDEEILLPEHSRCLTLLGSDMLFWLSSQETGLCLEIARTRAYENRVFLVRSSSPMKDGRSFICDPNGRVLASAFMGWEQAFGCQVELSLTKCKEVVPGTDVIQGRRPYDYDSLCQ